MHSRRSRRAILLAALAILCAALLAACGGGDDGAPLTMAERLANADDGVPDAVQAREDGRERRVGPPDEVVLMAYTPELRRTIVEALAADDGEVLLLRARTPEDAIALMQHVVQDFQATVPDAVGADLEGVPGGRVFSSPGGAYAIFTDGPFVHDFGSEAPREVVEGVARRWYERVAGRPHAD